MAYKKTVSTSFHKYQSDDYRRDELIRIIEHSVEKLTLAELEATRAPQVPSMFPMPAQKELAHGQLFINSAMSGPFKRT